MIVINLIIFLSYLEKQWTLSLLLVSNQCGRLAKMLEGTLFKEEVAAKGKESAHPAQPS